MTTAIRYHAYRQWQCKRQGFIIKRKGTIAENPEITDSMKEVLGISLARQFSQTMCLSKKGMLIFK